MDWKVAIPTLATVLTALLGWFVVHHFNLRREIAAEKRKMRIGYLLEAYRRLENAGNREIYEISKLTEDIETALADIQLLGTREQVELTQLFAERFAEEGIASFDLILANLRQTLRKELGLEAIDSKLRFLRITFKENRTTPRPPCAPSPAPPRSP